MPARADALPVSTSPTPGPVQAIRTARDASSGLGRPSQLARLGTEGLVATPDGANSNPARTRQVARDLGHGQQPVARRGLVPERVAERCEALRREILLGVHERPV